ncbi:MAG TPA: anti-sigma factor [Nocardioidaceae bacterium]|jgi:anti-sigma-K factor RskA|nr:anti-sigma factor [Nocardioidaceae bacterium]
MSTDLHTLSGAFALNALSAEEAEEFRRHLEACAVCRQEVRELQQAAARMGTSEAVPPPAYLKARVLAAADRTPQLPPRTGGGGTVIEVSPHRWGRRMLLAAAAVVLVVAGGIGISQLGNDADEQQSLLAEGVVRVFEAEDAHQAEMPTENGGRIRVAASPELNQMAVDTDELPPLDDQHVYQLWAVHDGAMESVGVLEPDKGAYMDMPTPDTEVAITVEPVGGSAQPTTDPIMRVNPSEI